MSYILESFFWWFLSLLTDAASMLSSWLFKITTLIYFGVFRFHQSRKVKSMGSNPGLSKIFWSFSNTYLQFQFLINLWFSCPLKNGLHHFFWAPVFCSGSTKYYLKPRAIWLNRSALQWTREFFPTIRSSLATFRMVPFLVWTVSWPKWSPKTSIFVEMKETNQNQRKVPENLWKSIGWGVITFWKSWFIPIIDERTNDGQSWSC